MSVSVLAPNTKHKRRRALKAKDAPELPDVPKRIHPVACVPRKDAREPLVPLFVCTWSRARDMPTRRRLRAGRVRPEGRAVPRLPIPVPVSVALVLARSGRPRAPALIRPRERERHGGVARRRRDRARGDRGGRRWARGSRERVVRAERGRLRDERLLLLSLPFPLLLLLLLLVLVLEEELLRLLRGRGGLGFHLLAGEVRLLARVLLLQGFLLGLLEIGVVRGVLGLDGGVLGLHGGVLRLHGRELGLDRDRLRGAVKVD